MRIHSLYVYVWKCIGCPGYTILFIFKDFYYGSNLIPIYIVIFAITICVTGYLTTSISGNNVRKCLL